MRFTTPLSTWAAAVLCRQRRFSCFFTELMLILQKAAQRVPARGLSARPPTCRAHTTSGLPQHPRICHSRTCHTGLCSQRVRLRGLMQNSWGTDHFVVVKSLGTIRRTAAISGMKPPLLGTEFSLYGQVVSPWALLRENQKPDQSSTL